MSIAVHSYRIHIVTTCPKLPPHNKVFTSGCGLILGQLYMFYNCTKNVVKILELFPSNRGCQCKYLNQRERFLFYSALEDEEFNPH